MPPAVRRPSVARRVAHGAGQLAALGRARAMQGGVGLGVKAGKHPARYPDTHLGNPLGELFGGIGGALKEIFGAFRDMRAKRARRAVQQRLAEINQKFLEFCLQDQAFLNFCSAQQKPPEMVFQQMPPDHPLKVRLWREFQLAEKQRELAEQRIEVAAEHRETERRFGPGQKLNLGPVAGEQGKKTA